MTDPDDILTEMSDEALIRATLGRDGYDSGFLDRVDAELLSRGLTIESYANDVGLRDRTGESSCNLAEAYEQLDLLTLWSPVEWTNALGDRLAIHKEVTGFLAHRYDETGYVESARFDDGETRGELDRFLNLKPADWVGGIDLSEWVTVDKTASSRFLQRVVQEFADRNIDPLVIPPDPDSGRKSYEIRVSTEDSSSAKLVLSELYAKIEALEQHVIALADSDDRKKELETYDLLKDLVPGKPAVFYNRASVLYELGDLEGAVEGLLEAMSLGMPEEKLFESRINPTGLTIASTARNTAYPDYFEDIEAYLIKIEPDLPEHLALLHGLATIARIKDRSDLVLGYYTRILDIDPSDQVAGTNQAFLLAEEETK